MSKDPRKSLMFTDRHSERSISIDHLEDSREEFSTDPSVRLTLHSTPEESARWTKIAGFLEVIRRRLHNAPLRMIEVGSGRGWLTNLLSMYYGACDGLEPILELVQEARTRFPSLRMTRGTPTTFFSEEGFQPYDVVISSQDIQSMPTAEHAAFIRSLRNLLKPGGYILLTGRRSGSVDQWKHISSLAQQTAGWLTEQQLRTLLETEGLQCLGQEYIYVEQPSMRVVPAPTPDDLQTLNLLPVNQVWICHWAESRENSSTPRFNRPPLVSVIVPTYNRPYRLREALQSILTQSLQDFEIIVVNDGETDITSVIETLPHNGRITTVKHDRNRGLAASRNTGLRLAQGTYIAYLDDDDRYYPDHLAVLVNALQKGGFQVAYSDAMRAFEIGAGKHRDVVQRDLPYSCDFDAERLFVSNYLPVLCMMHERACLEKVGLFDETLFAHEDWDLWIRLAIRYPFLHIKHTTAEFSWRTDGSSMTSSARETYLRTTEIIYRKYRPYTECVPGMLDAQQRELDLRRQALESSEADANTGERMYQRHRQFRTLHIFKEFLSNKSPRMLFMGMCSLVGMSYWRFCRLARLMVKWKQALHVPQKNQAR